MFLPFQRGPRKTTLITVPFVTRKYTYLLLSSLFFLSALFSRETAENVCFLLFEVETLAV